MSTIKELLPVWLPNTPMLASEMLSKGVSRQLQTKYAKSGWIERIEPGCYKKPGESVDWRGAVYTIQKKLALPVHISGQTALSLHGIQHHLYESESFSLFLMGMSKTALPRWFLRGNWEAKIHFKTSYLFGSELGLAEKEMYGGNFSIQISTPERAILEVLSFVTDEASFEDAANLYESVQSWDLQMLKALMNECHSFKAKRIFLFLAKRRSEEFYKSLEPKNINIGTGTIQCVKFGRYDRELKITVPSPYIDEQENQRSPF